MENKEDQAPIFNWHSFSCDIDSRDLTADIATIKIEIIEITSFIIYIDDVFVDFSAVGGHYYCLSKNPQSND